MIADFTKPLNRPSICVGLTSAKFHGPTAVLHRLEHRVLADALGAAEHQRVVDLLVGALDALREPEDEVLASSG